MKPNVDIDCNIFYVDDDRDDLELFKEMAESIGEHVCVFSSADLMLHTLNNPPPDPSVVFVDLNMPIRNGYDVIFEIRNSDLFKHIPIVVLSTASSPAIVEKCRKLGASLYVVKPNSAADLKKIIMDVVQIDWHKRVVTPENFLHRVI
ncbi:MAG TPA: response regulator [Flavobacterium sp.]